MKRLIQWLNEVRQRSVFRALGRYLVGSWMVLQIGDVTFAPLGLPSWAMTALIIATIAALPLVMDLAWPMR